MASMTPMWFVAPLVVLVLVGMTVVVLAIVIAKLWQFRALERAVVIRQPVECPDALRSGLRSLEVIASAAPLFGASGTVLGLLDAFRRLDGTESGVEPQPYSPIRSSARSWRIERLGTTQAVTLARNAG